MSSPSILADDRGSSNPTRGFDPVFRVSLGARSTAAVSPDHDGLVILEFDSAGERVFSPSQALALAAALQAVAVFLMEEPRELRRSTVPGAPSFEDLEGAGL